MKKAKSRIAILTGAMALVFGAAGSSFAQSGQHAQHGTATGGTSQQHNMGTSAEASKQNHNMPGHEMMRSMDEMHQKMSSMKMTGDHDHDFAMMMRSHHQAGLDMAKAQLKNGKDRQMQEMAKKIVSDQTKEIRKLDQWLAKHQASHK